MMDWAIASGIGIGTIIGSLITIIGSLLSQRFTAKENNKKLIFDEKKQAYTGLLEALHLAAVKASDENSKNYALWQTKVTLVGSPEVVKSAQDIVDTNDDLQERKKAFGGLLQKMREDLGIDKRKLN